MIVLRLKDVYSDKKTAECRHKYLAITGDSKFKAPTKRGDYWVEHQPVHCDDCGLEFIRERVRAG